MDQCKAIYPFIASFTFCIIQCIVLCLVLPGQAMKKEKDKDKDTNSPSGAKKKAGCWSASNIVNLIFGIAFLVMAGYYSKICTGTGQTVWIVMLACQLCGMCSMVYEYLQVCV